MNTKPTPSSNSLIDNISSVISKHFGHPVTIRPAAPKLPRNVFILSKNGVPLGAYVDKATADEDKFICLQADERNGEFNCDYEVTPTRLCYAKKQ